MKKTIDARGKQCPIPVVEAKKALDSFDGGGSVEVRVDNLTAVENLKRLADSMGGRAGVSRKSETDYLVVIEVENTGKNREGSEEANSSGAPSLQKHRKTSAPETVVVYSSSTMGNGDDELGSILIKGFTYALTQLEDLPAKLLFYNGGAQLTSEGSPLLEDLKKLEELGTDIITCGTCADFFKIKDKLQVGRIGNMYDIVEAMAKADKILRP
jgi:selenium metabolism protein YedF